MVFAHPSRGTRFQFAQEIRQRDRRSEAEQHVNVIGHTVDLDRMALLIFYNTGEICEELVFPGRSDKRLAVFCGENEVVEKMSVRHRVGYACFTG